MSKVFVELNGTLIYQRIKDSTTRGVKLAAEHLRSEAVALTPINQGDLRASADVKLLTGAQTGASAAVYYSIIYAARQHEETTWKHPRGGQSKFLQTAANREVDNIKNIVRQAVKGVL